MSDTEQTKTVKHLGGVTAPETVEVQGSNTGAPQGQPGLYRPEYCERVIELGKQGMWMNEICAELDIGRTTLADWEELHEDFAKALTRARSHANAWLEREGRKALKEKVFQARPWEVLLKGRDPEYVERKEVSGRGGQPIEITLSKDDLDL